MAIEAAKADTERPSFITVKTQIGFGCPAKQGKASAHGEPLGDDNIKAMKENLGWPSEEPFFVPEEVYDHYKEIVEGLQPAEDAWNKMFAEYCEKYPEMKELWDTYYDEDLAEKVCDDADFWAYDDKADATRNLSGKMINRIKDRMPNVIGGAADLSPSTKTYMKDEGDFSAENYAGRNMHFGVRELAMTAIGNGIMLHGGLRAFVSTFFVFSDYTKPMARLSSIMGVPLTFVFTHDSIGVGEDGPTHEPIEQLAMWRAMPNFHMFRPADATETAAAWYSAITSKRTPTALALTRQNLPQIEGTSREAEDGIDVRVVSMPCMDIFEEQSEEYKAKVLPKNVRKRVAVEALSGFGWDRYVGLDGDIIGMNRFGASAPYSKLFPYFGFTVENVVARVKAL